MVRHLIIYIVCLLASLLTQAEAQDIAQRTTIRGRVCDSEGNAMQNATVRLTKSQKGCVTDGKGQFAIQSESFPDTLTVSSIGFISSKTLINKRTRYPLEIRLDSTSYQIKEIEIKPGRERYSRKDNPAVDLLRNLLDKKGSESLYNCDFWSRDCYENLEIALDNFNDTVQSRSPFNKFSFLKYYTDISDLTGQPVLNISSRESFSTEYYQKDPERRKTRVSGRNWAGIDDFLSEGEIQASVDEAIQDIDLTNDRIIIFRRDFPSPLASEALSTTFYRYYLLDTVYISGQPCTDLAFTPANRESLGFSGHIYVSCDSSLFIRRVEMETPQEINMNFIKAIQIRQDFIKDSEGHRLTAKESFRALITPIDEMDWIYARRSITYSNYKTDASVDASVFEEKRQVIEEADASKRDESFWAGVRPEGEKAKTARVKEMVSQLRQNRAYRITEKAVDLLFKGYIPVSGEEPQFYYGPLNTTVSYNGLEGIRLRTGGMTTAHLSPRLFAKGYVAYGTLDKKIKGMAQLEYSFLPKKECSNEFPVRSVTLKWQNDINQYGQSFDYTNQDNFVNSLRRRSDDRIGYLKQRSIAYNHEFYDGFSFTASVRSREFMSSRLIGLSKSLSDGSTEDIDGISVTDMTLKLRYAPGEKFVQKHWDRKSVTPAKPVFALSHSISKDGFLGSSITMQKTDASYRQRIYLTPFGYTDAIVKGSRIWGQVPFPLLEMPNSNLAYAMRQESYELLTPMEFMLDSYASWDIKYCLEGLIMNRIPGLKKLGLREVLTYRGFWGTLREENDPRVSTDEGLLAFPDKAIATRMGNTPYMELGIGVGNIFKVLRVDYVHRLTYKNTPGTDSQGVRISVKVEF